MARKRASMREGPLAELFRATEAAQRGETPASVEATTPTEPEYGEQQAIEIPPPAAPELPVTTPAVASEPPDVAFEETVEHVYDFEVADAPPQPARGAAEPSPPPAPST